MSLLLSSSFVLAQSLTDGISVHKLSDFRNGKVKNCPIVDGVLGYKLYKKHTKGHVPLSDREFNELFGSGVEFIGLTGGNHFYGRDAGGVVGLEQIYMKQLGHDINDAAIFSDPKIMAELQNASLDKLDGDIPVICGDGKLEEKIVADAKVRAKLVKQEAEMRAKVAEEQAEYEKTCEICNLAGGYYLQTIYNGDFDRQNTLAGEYLDEIALVGGDEAMALGMIINTLGAKGNDFTFLEDVLGYYLLATSRKWPNQCYGPGSSEVTFTTTYPEQVYETLNGIYLGSDPAVTKVTSYKVKPEFKTACRSMCNKNGGLLITARIAGASGQKMDAFEVYKGITQLLSNHACDSETIQLFERNLLNMWGQEKAQPRNVRRNSIGNYWRQ
ncbi:MAG: hypothetical protein AB8B89_05110 [Gammaproteobacteria bacterium]